jgi:subtilase family serine protease
MLRRLVPLAAAGALLAGLLAPTAAAQLDAAAQPGANADARVTFLAGLPRDTAALDVAAVKRSTPGDLLYRDHPSLTQAGKDFGAASRDVTRLRNVASSLGITATVDRGRILTRLTASVADWEKVYGQRMTITPPTADYPYTTYSFPAGDGYAGAPEGLKAVVREMAAVYVEYAAAADSPGPSAASLAELQGTLADPGSPQRWPRNLGTLPPGTCDAPALTQRAVYAPGQIQTAYGTRALASKGIRGQGARVTVVSLGGGYDDADLRIAAECFGYDQPPITVVRGTGVPRPFVNATIETHLDLVTVSSVLPRSARIRLLQVPDAYVSFTEAFARMLDAPVVPDAVSISYGGCEPAFAEEYAALLPLNEDLLRMAAIVGTTVVVATGDNGTSMCGAEVAAETGEPTLWYPATSPWVTAVGGTRLGLKPDNTRRAERVWNDMPYVGSEVPAPAGAGGPSMVFDRPWWQSGVTPAGPRAVPDVSVLGAIKPGWPLAYGGGIYGIGGTSGGAPYVAANLAAMSAKQRDRGYPTIGFANAWLYAAAAGKKSPYFDIIAGNNEVQPVGCCTATRGYDMASGLGVPAMDRLYPRLPLPAG